MFQKIKWFLQRNKIAWRFVGTQEQFDEMLKNRKWFEHKNYVLELKNTR